jgi:hypothetical protein
LSNMGTKGGQMVRIDPNVKDKDIIPLMNKKAIDDIRNNKNLNHAQKMGELKAYSTMAEVNLRQQLQQAARQQANPRVTEPVVPGGPPRNIPETQAAGYDVQRYAAQERAKANVPKEAREVRKEGRDIGRYKKEMGAPERDFIKSAPEIKFFDKHGLPPSAFLRPESLEQGYIAKQKATGNPIGEFAPLKPGEKLENLPNAPTGWEYFKQTFIKNRSSKELDPNVEFVPKGGAFRVSEYKFGGVPSKNIPAETKYAPDPGGEFLQIGDKRVPYEEAAQIRAIAKTRHDEAIQALRINPNLRPKIENRLQEWHYDLTDPFWADLYK